MAKKSLIVPIFVIYFLPIALWIAFTHQLAPIFFGWLVATTGFALLFFGAALLYLLLKPQAEPVPTPQVVSAISDQIYDTSPELQEQIDALQRDLTQKDIDLETSKNEIRSALEENRALQENIHAKSEEYGLKEEEARTKIETLQIEGNQKQYMIQQLENQIHDLRYEIKTLLHLTEFDYAQNPVENKEEISLPQEIEEELLPTQIDSPEGAKRLLKRCIDIAQKMSPAYRASNLRTLSQDPYAFDLRRLSDSLRLESGALILVYSPKDERILFSNKEAKTLLGWNSDKFAQDFFEIIEDDLRTWQNGLSQMIIKSEVNFKLIFKTKNQVSLPLNGIIGTIPTGIFRSLVVGVFYTIT